MVAEIERKPQTCQILKDDPIRLSFPESRNIDSKLQSFNEILD